MDAQFLLFTHHGRLNRQPYWLACLALTLGALVIEEALKLIGLNWIGVLVSIVTIYPSIMLAIKRCHDRDRSGWFVLVGLVPVIGTIWLLVELGFLRGTVGPNRFGPDPLG